MPGRADVQTSISEGRTVAAVMLTNPKTLPAGATVADARSLFENPRVQTALIVEGSRFLGALDRDQIPEDALGTRLVRWCMALFCAKLLASPARGICLFFWNFHACNEFDA